MAYVEIGILYDQFQMTDDYDKEFFSSESQKAYEIDSLKMELTKVEKLYGMATANDKPALQNQYDALFLKIKELDGIYQNSNQMLKQQMNTEIFNKINEYMKEYGEEKGYSIIWGANGNGNIMYGEEGKNITEDVLKYINEKYENEK